MRVCVSVSGHLSQGDQQQQAALATPHTHADERALVGREGPTLMLLLRPPSLSLLAFSYFLFGRHLSRMFTDLTLLFFPTSFPYFQLCFLPHSLPLTRTSPLLSVTLFSLLFGSVSLAYRVRRWRWG